MNVKVRFFIFYIIHVKQNRHRSHDNSGKELDMTRNIDVVELFKMWEDGNKLSTMDLVINFFEYNKMDFDIAEARKFIAELGEEIFENIYGYNKVSFVVDKLGHSCFNVYTMGNIDKVMYGWSASKVCKYCCSPVFSRYDAFFYIDDLHECAYSVNSLNEAFDIYGVLNDFYIYYLDEFNEFMDYWSDDNIEDIERNEYIENEIGNIYMY